MPELPEVQALADVLDERLRGLRLASLDILAVSALKTADPPYLSLLGRHVERVSRRGKFLVVEWDDGLALVLHLARAGWLKLLATVPSGRPRPGRGPLVLRAVFVTDQGEPVECLDVTEAGTRKGVAVYVVREVTAVPGIAALGPDAAGLDVDALRRALATAGSARLKNALRDQRVIAGIGNAYSDDILHAAGLSPFQAADTLDEAQLAGLADALSMVLGDATARAAKTDPTSLKAEKRDGLAVHGRTGQPCPVCGTVIAEVALADRSFQYCPKCQTGGRLLSDRRMSRLLK